MEIKIKDTSNISMKTDPRAMSRIPLHSFIPSVPSAPSSPQFSTVKSDLYNKKRPLKTNSLNLSFKGLFFKETSFDAIESTIKKFGAEFGSSAKANLEEKIASAHLIEKSGLKIKGDKITFKEKTLGKRFLDLLAYPVTQMPLDIANSALKLLKKVPGLKNSATLDNLLNAKTLKDRRELLEIHSNVAAIQNSFEIINPKEGDNVGNLFKDAHNRFNPLIANYNTIAERTLTRTVSGALPAFFLANDAYNLSIYVNDNKELAKKEKKRRFNQEATRIGITAAATYGILTLFAKSSNSSAKMTTALITGVTLVSEIIGRMMAGTPVLPVGVNGAKYYAKKQGKLKAEKKEPKFEWVSDESFKGKKFKNKGAFAMFEGRGPISHEYGKPPKKGSLTFKNMLKVVGLLAVAGFGVEKASNIKSIKKVLEELSGKYKNLYLKDAEISRVDFDALTNKLEKEGFEGIAKKYKEMVGSQKGDVIKLGKYQDKVRYALIHQVLTFPVRFAWNTVMLPYNFLVKAPFEFCSKGLKKILTGKEVEKTVEELAQEAKDKTKKQNEMLRNSFKFLKKIDTNENYKQLVNDSILDSLDNVTKSSSSNAKLSSSIKITTSAVTSGFLIADNYNMVMIDSSGKDKELAEQKAKERTIQRAARTTYGAFIITLFNDMFRKTYNASLIGAASVTIGNTLITEILERKSVGLPLGESTREGINAKEKENLESDGFRGKYYRAMSFLTGKKSLADMKKAKQKGEAKGK